PAHIHWRARLGNDKTAAGSGSAPAESSCGRAHPVIPLQRKATTTRADAMATPPLRPLIGLPACVREINGWPFHACGEKYLAAVVQGTDGIPLVIPALGDGDGLPALVASLDGLMLTGSPSNVEPHHYEGPASVPGTKHDPNRDATTLPLIREAIRAGLPLFAICRGIQELNVALGGTLHQRVQELPGKMDHRMRRDEPREVQY